MLFTANSSKVNYNLDKLLITQGRSSHNWEDIFEAKESYKHRFEQGIDIVANIEGKLKKGYLVFPLKNNSTKIFSPSETDSIFVHKILFPEDSEKYKVS